MRRIYEWYSDLPKRIRDSRLTPIMWQHHGNKKSDSLCYLNNGNNAIYFGSGIPTQCAFVLKMEFWSGRREYRYEQDHPARISDGEVIDSMALSRPVTDGIRSAGFISDKTMRIATQFRDKKERLNQEAVMEIAQELHAVERQISKLEFYVSQLEEKQAEVIRGYYFEGKTWGELQQEMHLSPRTLIKRRDDGLDGLASMYSYLGQVKGGYGNT